MLCASLPRSKPTLQWRCLPSCRRKARRSEYRAYLDSYSLDDLYDVRTLGLAATSLPEEVGIGAAPHKEANAVRCAVGLD